MTRSPASTKLRKAARVIGAACTQLLSTLDESDIGGKVALAVGLALIAAPLAWLPFAADRNEIAVRYLRIEDLHTGRIVSVKMIGDPSGTVAVGDTLAIWGVEDGGNLFMRAAFNYTTHAEVRLRT